MSPQAGQILVEEIAPRIRAAVPRYAKPVGAEDHEELVQECIAMAAQMLHRVEEIGMTVTPGNIAYYANARRRATPPERKSDADFFNSFRVGRVFIEYPG